jgi:ribonuclease VapC
MQDAAATRRLTSPIAVFETVLAVTRVHAGDSRRARHLLTNLLDSAQISIVPIDAEAATAALEAHARYGKGSGHPARLNMGDCFAYAMAKQHGVPLLYKGDDFAETDLA